MLARLCAALSALCLIHEVEDTGRPTAIDLAPLSGTCRPRPWFRKWNRLSEYSVSANGRYVLFTDRSASGERQGGDIYLGTAEGQEPRRVLPATKSASFSGPSPRPTPQE